MGFSEGDVGLKPTRWGQRVPPFSTRVFPVTDEAVESDGVLVWCGVSALEWVLAWL